MIVGGVPKCKLVSFSVRIKLYVFASRRRNKSRESSAFLKVYFVNFVFMSAIISEARFCQDKRSSPGISHVALRAPRKDMMILCKMHKMMSNGGFWDSPNLNAIYLPEDCSKEIGRDCNPALHFRESCAFQTQL